MAFIHTPDESVVGPNGRILYFSIRRFIRDICEGDCCFICGASALAVPFDDEHILPRWVLRKYGLYNKCITLPNGTAVKYSQYTIPCCQACNALMGRTFEKGLRELFEAGYEAVLQYVTDNGPWTIFVWLSLIFLKIHLKDKTLRLHRDRRKEDHKVADFYTWEELHHVHCVARSFYTGCELDAKVHGSFFLIPAQMGEHIEPFDYGDLYVARTVLLRLGDVAVVSVLNDSCAVWNVLREYVKSLSGPLSAIQLREFMARCAYVNLRLTERPTFFSEFNPAEEKYRISAELPDLLSLEEDDQSAYGALLYSACKDILSGCLNDDIQEQIEQVKQGRITFLLDESGRFRINSMQFRDVRRAQKDSDL